MKDFFEELLDYNHHMNELVIRQLATGTWPEPTPLYRLLNHILTAHHIWNKRLQGQVPDFAVWGDVPRGELLFLDKQNTQQSQALLTELPLDLSVSYTNSKGDVFTNSVQDIVYHVINHSNYHRAQIATEVRRQGGTPLTTDYIFYRRG